MLIAGSRVKVGFAYDIWNPGGITTPDANNDTVYMRDVIEGALYNTGEFSDVTVSITPASYLGLQDGYILVEATTAVDKGKVEDFASLTQGLIQENLPAVALIRRDPAKIIAIPQTAIGQSGIDQPNDNSGGGPPSLPGQCDWDKLTLGDYLACQTGYTKSTALLLGVAVTLGVLFAISSRR